MFIFIRTNQIVIRNICSYISILLTSLCFSESNSSWEMIPLSSSIFNFFAAFSNSAKESFPPGWLEVDVTGADDVVVEVRPAAVEVCPAAVDVRPASVEVRPAAVTAATASMEGFRSGKTAAGCRRFPLFFFLDLSVSQSFRRFSCLFCRFRLCLCLSLFLETLFLDPSRFRFSL